MAYNKYRVSPKEERTVDGITFDSKKEMKRYCELKVLERGKRISNLELHPRFDIVVNGKKIGFYKADFRYVDNGTTVIEDTKGVRTTAYRLKKKLVEAIYGINITEL